MAFDLLNVCLEMIVRADNKDTTCIISNKALQIMRYTNGLDIMTRDIISQI